MLKRQILNDLDNIITILCITSFDNTAKLLSQSYIHNECFCAFTWDISKALYKASLPFPIADVELYLHG